MNATTGTTTKAGEPREDADDRGQLSPLVAIAELHPMLADFERAITRDANQTTACMTELAAVLTVVAKCAMRGYVTPEQLVDVRARAASIKRRA